MREVKGEGTAPVALARVRFVASFYDSSFLHTYTFRNSYPHVYIFSLGIQSRGMQNSRLFLTGRNVREFVDERRRAVHAVEICTHLLPCVRTQSDGARE